MPDLTDALIFVDANILLSCYERTYANYKKLLAGLAPLAESIVFTSAVHDEFRRNRVGAYIKANKLERNKINIPEFSPHHQVSDEDKSQTEIREEKDKIQNQTKALLQKVTDFHLRNISAIVQGSDDVSRAIAPLVAVKQKATQAQLERARARKELGNPPGKKADPLGDQISWEQLLDHVHGKSSIWIVSDDGDYSDKVEDKIFLNPYLYDELRERSSKISIFCFKNLAEFFDTFQKSVVAAAAPIAPDVIESAKQEFAANAATQATVGAVRDTFLTTCPRCNVVQHAVLVPKPSKYGGWSYWQICRACGNEWDTGDPYDD